MIRHWLPLAAALMIGCGQGESTVTTTIIDTGATGPVGVANRECDPDLPKWMKGSCAPRRPAWMRDGTTGQQGACDPSYPSHCLDPTADDYDCENGDGDGPEYVDGPVTVHSPDPFDLDRDGDGIACDF